MVYIGVCIRVFIYRVFRGVLGCIYGVYSYITGVNKCVTYGNEGVYRVYYDGFT